MMTSISSKGRTVLPAALRRQDGIKPGQHFSVERLSPGEYRLIRAQPASNEGLIDLLLACPVKDWFSPVDRVESTRDIPPSRFR